jgi:esterase/lipase
MTKIDIVALIESNPLTKLSSSYNNKLLIKIKDTFTSSQQQLFISSFYCWLNYHALTDFVIDLDNIWKWLGFGQKDTSKRLLEKHFMLDKDYKLFIRKEEQKGRGGSNKETILLNIKTFKLFCLKAGTKKADEIHEYFIKLEEMLQDVIQQESNELKQQLDQIKETHEKERKQIVLQEREKLLLREFASDIAIVYIIKVKTFENGHYIIKIGESRNGIQKRYMDHKKNYGEIVLLDCFKVSKSQKFEKFLHYHKTIRPNRVNDLEGHEKEVELFLIGKELTYDMILTIINDNINNYKDENEIIMGKLMDKLSSNNTSLSNVISTTTEISSDMLQKIFENQIQMSKQIQELEKTNKEILDRLTKSQTKTQTNFHQPLTTISHRLQKINPETMTITKIYDTVAQCLSDHNYRLKRPSIEKAIQENRIYNGSLWAYVDREKDPNIIHIPITINPSRPQNNGYIAKINKDETEIINVYLDRKTAALQNGYKSHSGLDNPVKNKTLTNNNYYILYDKCEPNIIKQFIEKNGEPILYKGGVGQFDANNQLVREFVCKYDCIKQLKISDKTLAKTLDKNILYNHHYFRSLGEKLFI